MQFMLVIAGWQVTFLEQELKTPLPRKFMSQEPVKAMEMAMRGGADRISADKQAIEYAFSRGRGLVWLNLTLDQYGKIRC